MISFGTKYWIILLPAIIALALGVVIVLYYKNKDLKELSKTQLNLLKTLRFLSFSLLAFLLLSPFLRNLKRINENPVIISAWDNSSSMVATLDSLQLATQIKEIQNKMRSDLGKDFTLIEYSFGETTIAATDELDYVEKKSDYSELFSKVINNHFNQKIGAFILVGDGIYNQGKNPVNLLSEINFPVYTVGLGDTSEVADSRIENIRVNRTSFSGNRFPVEIDMFFSKLKGKSLKLSVWHNEKELASEIMNPPNNNYFETKEFIFEAGNAGLKHYTVNIEAIDNERNKKNNSASFVINVLENKQKVLILSDGPHPDIGAIKNTLDLQKTYEVTVFTEEPYPSNLSDFNLVVLNQLPTVGKSIAMVVNEAEKARIPILFIVGNKTFLPQLNALDQGIKITPLAGSKEEAQPSLNPTYATFSLSEEMHEIVPKLPPIQVPFADYVLESDFTPIFYQKIKNIETVKPLIATGTINGRKTGFILGEGIWRWRLFNYYNSQNQDRFNELINQIIQYLALRENEDNFIVEYKAVYAEIDDVVFNAEVYNDNYERVSNEEVNIEITNSNNEEYNFTFDIKGNSYYLNAGHLPTGDYSFTSEVKLGDKSHTEKGNFTITPVNFENIISQANHQVLYQLALQSGGAFYTPEQYNELIQQVKSNSSLTPSVYFKEMITELLNFKWLFPVLLLLLSVEWFLRKYWGIY